MTAWIGVALATAPAGADAMDSRLPTYLHPMAGRPLYWHTLSALAAHDPPPPRLHVVTNAELRADLFADLPVAAQVDGDLAPLLAALGASGGAPPALLLVDAAAPTLHADLPHLTASAEPLALLGADGLPVAVWLPPERLALLHAADDLAGLAGRLPAEVCRAAAPDGFVVRDRVAFAGAVALTRDRLVRRLMENGASVLLPQSVLVDVDVRVGRDTILYPGVMLEGQTTVGQETVIGPGCRIVDSWIGSGVELKGWNYVSHTSIRNRAILEPYVRRGYD